MDIVDFGTPFGLAFASGLNAYLPPLAFALSVRWLHLYKVNQHFAFVTQGWFIALLAILTLLDFVADKIPLIDHAWNAIHTVVRPIVGAAVAVIASSHALPVALMTVTSGQIRPEVALAALSAIPVTGVGLLVMLVIIGAALATLSHTTKSTARLVSTLTTAGFLNVVLSLVEDVLVLIVVALSLFASAVMLILLVLLVFFLVTHFLRSRNNWIRRY